MSELEEDYLTQLKHVNALQDELDVEYDKLSRLEAALIAERNRRQSPLENYIGALGSTSCPQSEKP